MSRAQRGCVFSWSATTPCEALALTRFDPEQAKSVRLPELVDRFVAFFEAGDYVSPRAWDDAQGRAQGPCVLADEDWVMLKGEGCRQSRRSLLQAESASGPGP